MLRVALEAAGQKSMRPGTDRYKVVRRVWSRRDGEGMRLLLVTGLLLATMTPLGCNRAAPVVTLRVGLPGTVDDLPYHVIRAQGLDTRHGLRLELSEWPGGAQVLEALAAGQLDVSSSVGTVPILNGAVQGIVPARTIVIAGNAVADPTHPSNAIVVGPTVKSWADLRDQLIGVHHPNSLAAAAAIARLRLEGVVGYRFVTIPHPNLGLAVAGGTVAAASMSEPFVTQAVQRGDGRVLGWIVGGPPFERLVVTLTVVRAEIYRDQRPGLRALLRAFLAAVAWIDAHPAEARSMTAARLGITDALGQTMAMPRWPLDGRVDRRLLVDQQAILVEAGLLKQVVPADQIIDETLLVEVLGERR
jgi:NitT/TauT family transport system substrate-binding protein